MDGLYSLENARKYKWSSVSGNLNPERVAHLEHYVVGPRVLDAGCGGGAYVEYLAGKGLEVTGVDKYEQFLEVAREQAALGTYEQGDVTALRFADGSFDCTYCFDVLEHVDDRAAAAELARVTTRRLIVAVPREDEVMSRYNLSFLHYRDKTHLRNYTEDSLRALLAGTGASRVTVFPELHVPVAALVREMTRFEDGPRGEGLRTRILRSLFDRVVDRASFPSIPTGLVGVAEYGGRG